MVCLAFGSITDLAGLVSPQAFVSSLQRYPFYKEGFAFAGMYHV